MTSVEITEKEQGEFKVSLMAPLTASMLTLLKPILDRVTEVYVVVDNELGDTDILGRFLRLTTFSIRDEGNNNLAFIESLVGLKALSINNKGYQPNLKLWPELRVLQYVDKIGSLSGGKTELETLSLMMVKAPDLSKFSAFSTVRELELRGGMITSMTGLAKAFPMLETLFVQKLSKLSDISEIGSLGSLTTLTFVGCTKLFSLESLATLRSLRALRLIDCGEIASLEPIRSMPNLRECVFPGTTKIMDANTNVLRELGLEFGFQNRKSYNFNYDHMRV